MVDLEAETKKFERKLKEVEEDGADPLSVWSAHLEWMEANKLARHECYKKTLQRCVQYFSWSNMSGYKSDYRLATIYLKMAKICTEPIAIYQHMLENSIGPHYAPFYDTYAAALGEKGKVDEAIKLVERAMAQNAQPMKKLQLRLEALKQSQVQQPISSTSNSSVPSSKQTATSSWEDEPCERNDAFYKQPGVKVYYPKELVYPREGGELQPEIVRARLPQYTPSFLNDSGGECDMDMTMAGGGHITMHVPCVPDLFKPGAMQLVQSSSSNKNAFGSKAKNSLEDKENMRENRQLTASRTVKTEQERQRKPLQSIKPPSPPPAAFQEENEPQFDELELLCAEQDQELLQKSQDRLNPLSSGGRTGGKHVAVEDKENAPAYEEEDDFMRQMEQLIIERDQAVAPPTQTSAPPLQPRVEEASVVHKENLSYLKDQENQPRERVKPSGFEFTPGSMEGGLHWPAVGQKNASGFINTRLNFSEADSTFGGEEGNSSRHHLSSSFGRATFNSTLDLERRAKVTDEQLKFESEFAITEVDTHGPWKRPGSAFSQVPMTSSSSVLEPSLSDSQSFEVFHDSWAHHSRNTSRGGNVSNISRGGNISRGMMNFSRGDNEGNVSHGGNVSRGGNISRGDAATSKPILGERRALQELPVPRTYAPPTELSMDHASYTASQSNMTSFSVFEDESCADQSSLAPFHDSWSNAPPPGPGAAASGQKKQQGVGVATRVYHAPLEAPIMHGGGGGGDNRERGNLTMEQSFTQFDIRHPTSFEPVSTPMGAHSALAWDVSAIPDGGLTEIEFFRPSKGDHTHAPPTTTTPSPPLPAAGQQMNPQQPGEPPLISQKSSTNDEAHSPPSTKPAPVMITNPSVKEKSRLQQHAVCPFNLSTITEESGSYKSSSSGSRLTVSSASSNSHSGLSGGTPHSQLTQHPPEDINPFEQHIVNMMLNTLGVPVGRMEKISGNLPRIISGHSIEVGGERYESIKKLVDGGFAKIYVGKYQGQLEALKIQSPALEWELAVIEELHTRLSVKGLQVWTDCFLEVKKAYRFNDASVLTMQYYPQGSLLDLVNAYNSNRTIVPETVLFYYGYEMLSTLATLHQCGIIHADVKPDNFMLKDLRPLLNERQFSFGTLRGKGVCLIDFGCSIDTQVFPEEAMFVGSNETDAFQCPAMIEGRPWKWQADYYGLAATFHVLLHGKYIEIQQEAETGLYQPKTKVTRRMFDVNLWNQLIDVLLNSPDILPLAELAHPLEEKLKQEKSISLRKKINSCCDTVTNHMKTKLK